MYSKIKSWAIGFLLLMTCFFMHPIVDGVANVITPFVIAFFQSIAPALAELYGLFN